MDFQSEHIYHIYNRGNNSQMIFFNRENYLFFLRKVRKELLPYCDILAYCLMPTHFHFMVYVKDISDGFKPSDRYGLNNAFGTLLRSYAQAINKQEGRTGSLFQQKTKSKCLNPPTRVWKNISTNKDNYPFICFNYIHQNPMKDGLVKRMEDWEFSSFRDYIGKRKGTLCNIKLAFELISLPDKEHIYEMSYQLPSTYRMLKAIR